MPNMCLAQVVWILCSLLGSMEDEDMEWCLAAVAAKELSHGSKLTQVICELEASLPLPPPLTSQCGRSPLSRVRQHSQSSHAMILQTPATKLRLQGSWGRRRRHFPHRRVVGCVCRLLMRVGSGGLQTPSVAA